MKYFLHDTNAFQDEKITELFIEFGYEGLGLFYTILERIGAQEKPIKTSVLKTQLKVGKKLEKCWEFMEKLDLISSSNGETFNERILSYSKKYQVQKEKNRERVEKFRAQQRENEEDTENETHYTDITKRECNGDKEKESKVKEVNISFENFWNEYGKKEGRKETEKKWNKLSDADRKKIMDILPAYKAKTPNVVYRKNPSTFLNQRVWEDDAYNGIVSMNVTKAVKVDDDGYVIYEKGPKQPLTLEDLTAFRNGVKPLSSFDRKAS